MSDNTSDTDDEKLLALARKATPGPWWWLDRLQNGERYLEGRGNGILVCSGMPGRVNADWIVAANPSAIIALIGRHRAEVDALRRERDEANRMISTTHSMNLAAKLQAAEAALAAAQKRIAELEGAGANLNSLITRAQEKLTAWLCPDSAHDERECMNELLEMLDGPRQRAIQSAWRKAAETK